MWMTDKSTTGFSFFFFFFLTSKHDSWLHIWISYISCVLCSCTVKVIWLQQWVLLCNNKYFQISLFIFTKMTCCGVSSLTPYVRLPLLLPSQKVERLLTPTLCYHQYLHLRSELHCLLLKELGFLARSDMTMQIQKDVKDFEPFCCQREKQHPQVFCWIALLISLAIGQVWIEEILKGNFVSVKTFLQTHWHSSAQVKVGIILKWCDVGSNNYTRLPKR